ncbi:MAG: DUF2062 domain-containing protein [Chthoniobacterales bacterium]
MLQRFIHHLHEVWRRFLQARDHPHSLAVGMAIGIFFGFFPPFCCKTLMAVGFAWLVRCNIIAAIVGVTIHDGLLWMWPLLWRWEFQVGHWLLSNPHAFAPKLIKSDFRISEIMQWDNFIDVGLPLLVGSAFIALPFALIAYVLTLFFMLRREKRST